MQEQDGQALQALQASADPLFAKLRQELQRSEQVLEQLIGSNARIEEVAEDMRNFLKERVQREVRTLYDALSANPASELADVPDDLRRRDIERYRQASIPQTTEEWMDVYSRLQAQSQISFGEEF